MWDKKMKLQALLIFERTLSIKNELGDRNREEKNSSYKEVEKSKWSKKENTEKDFIYIFAWKG